MKKRLLILGIFICLGFALKAEEKKPAEQKKPDKNAQSTKPKPEQTKPEQAKQDENSKPDFRETNWGMSREQVRKIEKAAFSRETERALVYEGKIGGLNCRILYFFAQEKLVRAKYLINEEHANKNDYIGDFNSLKESVIKNYGKPIGDSITWKNERYKSDPKQWGLAISIGDLSYFTNWDTPNTEIIEALFGDNNKISLGIQYASVKLRLLEAGEEEDEADKNL
jgi:hypothetical protein